MGNESDEARVRAVIHSWAQAVRDGDMEGVLARHTEDVVMFDVAPDMQARGLAEYRKTWELFFEYSPGGEGSFELQDLAVAAGDAVAFGHALLRIGGNATPECRLTIGLKKIDGEWLIAHEHHSAPHPVG
jgi:uncharacterized protein (TIGR02246 family)